MRNPESVEASAGILHLIGHGPHRNTVLSDASLDFGNQSPARGFIESHIHNALCSEQTIAGRWLDQQGAVSTACSSLFAHRRRLVPDSHRITNSLGQIIRDDARVATGALLIARFRVFGNGYVNGDASHIAILKLDPGDGFVPATHRQGGQTRISLRKIDSVVPSAREQLQKCAFVCDPQDRTGMPDGCDLLVLDRQRRGQPQPADFFMAAFLGAGRSTDDETLTKVFDEKCIHTINRLFRQELIDDEARNELYTHRAASLRSNTVNVGQFVENLPIAEEAKQIAREQFADIADREFHPDEATARRLTRMIVYRGEHKLKLSVDADHFAEVVESAEQVEDVERGLHWRVVIRTRQWQQVKSR